MNSVVARLVYDIHPQYVCMLKVMKRIQHVCVTVTKPVPTDPEQSRSTEQDEQEQRALSFSRTQQDQQVMDGSQVSMCVEQ